MSNIKYIDYDCTDIDNVKFDKIINAITTASYRVDKRSLFFNYSGTHKDLHTNLESIMKDKHILIFDISYPNYYGFHNMALWNWLNAQFGIGNKV